MVFGGGMGEFRFARFKSGFFPLRIKTHFRSAASLGRGKDLFYF